MRISDGKREKKMEKENPKDTISVLLFEEGKYPKVVEIERGLHGLQKAVGGDIEQFSCFSDGAVIICDDEGKLKGKPLNRVICDEDSGEMIEIIAGDFLIVYAPSTSKNYESLPPELSRKYAMKFYYPQNFFHIDGEIKAIPYRPKKDDPER